MRVGTFALCLLIFVGICGLIYRQSSVKKVEVRNKINKVAINFGAFSQPIDPINNTTLTNAFFNNNMYSNLIEVDNNNIYQNALADSVVWKHESNELEFIFNSENKFSVRDAFYSIKRVMLNNKNLHSDLWSIICGKNESRLACDKRIYIRENALVFNYADSNKSHLIIPTLASIDYKIVPVQAFDQIEDLLSSKIINYSITSGAYHLKIVSGEYFLVKNDFFTKNLNTIKEFQLVERENIDIQKAILNNDIDVIPTTIKMTDAEMATADRNGWSKLASHKLSIVLLVFTELGMKRLKSPERFSIGSMILENALTRAIKDISLTHEFFQDFGQGNLSNQQLGLISEYRNDSSNRVDTHVEIASARPHLWQEVTKKNKLINFVQSEFTKNYFEQPVDAYLVTNDVSFDLNYSLIAYAAKTGMLEMTNDDLMHFIELPDLESQIKFINEIHFKTLKSCKIYPLFASPYFTYTRKGLVPEMSKFNSRTLLWKIREE